MCYYGAMNFTNIQYSQPCSLLVPVVAQQIRSRLGHFGEEMGEICSEAYAAYLAQASAPRSADDEAGDEKPALPAINSHQFLLEVSNAYRRALRKDRDGNQLIRVIDEEAQSWVNTFSKTRKTIGETYQSLTAEAEKYKATALDNVETEIVCLMIGNAAGTDSVPDSIQDALDWREDNLIDLGKNILFHVAAQLLMERLTDYLKYKWPNLKA